MRARPRAILALVLIAGTLQLGAPFATAADSRTVTVGERSIQIEALPRDSVWLETVASQVTTSIVTLEQLIGRPLPGTGTITIRETASELLGPYAGTFNRSTGIIRIGEQIETGVVAHELAHVWFNDSLFRATWLNEGSASWAASSVTGQPCTDPGPYPGTGAPSLATWRFVGPRATVRDLLIIVWQYEAACYIVSSVASKVGADRMRTILGSLIDGTSAYRPGATDLALKTTGAGFDHWLDAVDELGLVPAGDPDLDYAQDLLAKYGASVDSKELRQRSATRALYHALRAAVGPWRLPHAIVAQMALWNFDQAGTAMASASKAFEYVTKADQALPQANVLNGAIKVFFEQPTDQFAMDKLGLRAFDQLQAAELVASAKARVEAPRAAVSALGLTPSRLESELAAAIAAVTQADLKAAKEAVAKIDARLADEVAAAEIVAAATERVDAPRDPLAQVGLLGTDLGPTLASARAAVGAIDVDATRMHAASIDQLLADAPFQGAIRLSVVLALILVVALAVFVVRRRRARAQGGGSQTPAQTDA